METNHFQFASLNGNAIIKDESALIPQYFEGQIFCKKDVEEKIISAIKPITQMKPSQNLFLYGPTGAGKTVLVRHILDHLRDYNRKVLCVYINCWYQGTSMAIYNKIADALGEKVSRRGRATDEIFNRIVELMRYQNTPILLVLDNIDALLYRHDERILRLKQKYPSWGARRIKHQFDLPHSWRTVHNIIKNNGLLVRINAKPQPCKRFQRKHVDSMWQGDTFQFRIHDVGKIYVTGLTDDCSRFRVRSKAYLRKGKEEAINCLQWALRPGRNPKAIYLDNGTQFIAKLFKAEAKKHKIKLIFGKPYHPQGRGKIEKYHGTLYQELISRKKFKSLSHFRRELWKFDQKYNYWRKQDALGWQTPASVYFNPKYFNKKRIKKSKKRTKGASTN